jgi:hypothetical protein
VSLIVWVLSIIAATQLIALLLSPWRGEAALALLGSSALATAVYFCGIWLFRAILRAHFQQAVGSRLKIVSELAERSITPQRMVAAAALMIALQVAVGAIASATGLSEAISEVCYYLVLLVTGALLGSWCRSGNNAPVLLPTLFLISYAAVDAILFVNSPSVRGNYGPETPLFAAAQYAARVNTLPLDIAVTLSAWRVATAIGYREVPSTALDSTGEPVL